MKKIKKLLIGIVAAISGLFLLAGCGNNAQTSHGNAKKNPSYNTKDLSEKKVGNVTFYTGKKDDWKDNSQNNKTLLQLIDASNDENVSLAVVDREFSTVEKTVTNLKGELEKGGAKNTQISQEKINDKQTFKLLYETTNVKGTQYYIELDKTHQAIVTYTKSVEKATNALEKEVEHLVNTIEYTN